MFGWLRRKKPEPKPLTLGEMVVYGKCTWDDNSRRLLGIMVKTGRLVGDNGGDTLMVETDGKNVPVCRSSLFRDQMQFRECVLGMLNKPRKLEW